MFRVLFPAALLVLVHGGRSPGADYIDQTLTDPGARYSNNILEDARLDVPGLVAKYGYPIETHDVVTEDGYGLTMHRIPHGREQNNRPDVKRPVVFLMHGLMASSAEFVLLGPGNALAYVLAEEGYDVWIGNARGNFYSRRHASLSPDRNRDFWRFSWDEIGNLDLPACFSYIEKVTSQTRFHFIGHSQGGTAFLVLNSLRPEYNQKFISFQGLAPGAFFRYNEHSSYQLMAPYIHILEPAIFALTRGEIMRNRQWITWFGSRFCHEGSVFSSMCASLIFGGSSEYFNQTMIPLFLGHSPAGSSFRQFAHYGQGINHDTFRRYDHNPARNLELYGSTTPPDYDMSLVTALSHLHYSVNDAAAHWKDVELLASKLPNAVLHKIDSPHFDHLDFLWGNGAKWKLYDRVIALMRQAEEL